MRDERRGTETIIRSAPYVSSSHCCDCTIILCDFRSQVFASVGLRRFALGSRVKADAGFGDVPYTLSKFLACRMMAPSASPLAASNPSITAASSSPRQMRSMFSRETPQPSFANRGTISALMGATRSSPCGSGIQGTAAIASKSLSLIFRAPISAPPRRAPLVRAEEDEDDEVEDDEEASGGCRSLVGLVSSGDG